MSENTDTPTVHWQVYIGTMTKQAVILEAFIRWLPFHNTTDVLATMTHYTCLVVLQIVPPTFCHGAVNDGAYK